MNIHKLKPRKALNKAFLKVKPNRTEIELFKANLIQLLDRANDTESEEFHKNLVSDFLKKTYYDPTHYINTKGRNDLVIHNGDKAKSPVGVIVEAKKPTNKTEMVSPERLNTKAFQELVLYYLRERITHKNLEVKHLVITNIYEWFLFDTTIFDRLFAQNKSLVKQFTDFEGGRLADTKTDFFYKQIAEPFIAAITSEIEFTYFNLQDYQIPLRNEDKADDRKLITLFKLFSPEHLLKLPFANDSNSLDKRFYSELLHIIGLIETKEGSKKLIGRNKEGQRNSGSLLENAIIQLESLDKVSRLDRPFQYGSTQDERLYNVALELAITWINRILFLKLLEAQLITYHKGDASYNFLNLNRIKDYDDLNSLFFQVLAKPPAERNPEIRKLFEKVPYLNSSLFEPSELEHTALFISNLRDDKKIPILSSTVLKNHQGKKRIGELSTLEYLFAFLDAYDFSSEGSEDIQEDNKTLINASVLGLIFEKINGYKDGSFFTPGFITMYMCRETLRKAVLQKFKEVKGWDCKDLDALYDKIEDREEANAIVNSLKICDPAVGSGHFLVSALNEIIAIKNDLKILQDRNGRRLKEYQVEVVNDELIVTDEEGELFEYNPSSKESQRVQETLFHEKQTLIENCLFGVDINPNSVKICRLRLWIELLKCAYYKETPAFDKNTSPVCFDGNIDVRPEYKQERELETLPNIDINIKCGNSLVSRFALDADLSKALKKSKWTIDGYRIAVDTYRNAQNKERKREMEKLIADIKSDFRSEISMNDPKVKRLRKLSGELFQLTNQGQLFDLSKKEKTAWNKKVIKLTDQTKKLEAEIEEIKANVIFEDAFEWRFEFPEVLNDEGEFVGFDVVIGNPPYIRIQDLSASNAMAISYYNNNYMTTGEGNYDLYIPFAEKGIEILKSYGEFCFIMPHKFINANYGKKLRGLISENKYLRKMVHFGANQIFEDATTYTGLFFISKKDNKQFSFLLLNEIGEFINGDLPIFSISPTNVLSSEQWLFIDIKESKLLDKLLHDKVNLESVTHRIYQGVKTSADKIFIVRLLNDLGEFFEVYCKENNRQYQLEKTFISPLIKGGNSEAFKIKKSDLLLIFPYRNGELISEEILKAEAPKTWSYLSDHRALLEARENSSFKGENWFAFGRNQAISVIFKPKIFTPDIAPSPRFSFDELGNIAFTGGAAGGYGIIPNKSCEFKILLAILNSKLAFWFIKKTSTQMRGGWYSFESRYIKHIPLPANNPSLKYNIELLVDEITALKKQTPWSDTTELEKKIDQLVYELYGLTEEEIQIVERN